MESWHDTCKITVSQLLNAYGQIEDTHMKLNKIVIGMTFAAALSTSQAFATGGTLGANSTGSTDVSLSIVDQVQISSVENIGLGAWSGSGNLTGATDFCVYRSGGDDYKVTLTTLSGAFELGSVVTGDTIPFTAMIDDDADASDGEALTYGTASTNALTGNNQFDCGAADNAELYIDIAESDLQAASSANDYSGTVTIFVEPI